MCELIKRSHTSRYSAVAKWDLDGAKFIGKYAANLQFDTAKTFEEELIRMAGGIINETPIGLDKGFAFVDGDPQFVVRGGQLRSNWQIASKPNNRVLLSSRGAATKPGFAARKITGKFARVNRQGTMLISSKSLYLFNNSPYGKVVEYGGYPTPVKNGSFNWRTGRFEKRSRGGYSKQAPRGMVRINVIRYKNRIRRAMKAKK